jgi:hypothetical protein
MLVQSNDLPHGVPAMADTGCMCHACVRCRVQADRFFRASPYGAPLFRVVRRIQGLRAIGYTPQDLADVFAMGTEYVEWLTHATRGHAHKPRRRTLGGRHRWRGTNQPTGTADTGWTTPQADPGSMNHAQLSTALSATGNAPTTRARPWGRSGKTTR